MPFVKPSQEPQKSPASALEEKQASTVQRDEKGRVLPGSVLNSEGKNGLPPGWSPIRLRLARILEKYTVKQIKEFILNPEKMDDLPSIDGAAITFLATMYSGKGSRNFVAVQEMLDGKPKQPLEHTGEGGKDIGLVINQIFQGKDPDGVVRT